MIVLLLVKLSIVQAQRIARFEVEIPKEQIGMAMPVQVSLDNISLLADSVLELTEITSTGRLPVACQVSNGDQRILHWIIQPFTNSAKTRIFELAKGKSPQSEITIKAVQADGVLTISAGNKNLLRYNYRTVYPPAGVDTVYKRSGFIHPLWSPRGQELTQINAPDHYHHWGLWNPWTEVLFEGDSVDFWNLARKQGTVRFSHFLSTTNGPVYAEYKALHEHVVFKKTGGEKLALNEVQTVKLYQPLTNQNYYIADITIQLNCASNSPVLLLEYRYGGLGLRATKDWDRNNSRILTSEGKARKEADGSTARWCMVQGAVKNDHAGLVLMSYPTNYNHPEPLRVWPEDTNGRGDVFLNFSPTKNKSWLLNPGKEYTLKYRLLVFNDVMPKEKAEAVWQNFAQAPTITIKTYKQ